MGLFSRNKKEVWKNAQGKYECSGDSCPRECDELCPIWLNTLATEAVMMGKYMQAMPLYKKGIEIAPDFPDLWNNLGMCYGYLSKYEEAFSAYKKAYELAGRKQALYGMTVASRDCGRIEDALEYCKEYKVKFGDGALDSVEERIMSGLQHNSTQADDCAVNDVENIISNLFSFYLKNNLRLTDTSKYIDNRVISDEEAFCNSVYDYCQNAFANESKKKFYSELIITTFYATIVCEKDEIIKEQWKTISAKYDPNKIDVKAEELLGLKNNKELADTLWGQVSAMLNDVAYDMMSGKYNKNGIITIMKYASRLAVACADKFDVSMATEGNGNTVLIGVCSAVAVIEEGLRNGTIEFTYDKLMMALKSGHPADILDDIISEISWDVYNNRPVSDEAIKNVYCNIKAFEEEFEVEMQTVVEGLEEYMNGHGVRIPTPGEG